MATRDSRLEELRNKQNRGETLTQTEQDEMNRLQGEEGSQPSRSGNGNEGGEQ